jgi:hypothetical protein
VAISESDGWEAVPTFNSYGAAGSLQELVADAKRNITEISALESAAKSKNGEAVLVDVREKEEWDKDTRVRQFISAAAPLSWKSKSTFRMWTR